MRAIKKALAAALQEHVEQSKATAGRVITDAADYRERAGAAGCNRRPDRSEHAQLRQDVAEARAAQAAKASAGVQTAKAARTTAIAASAIAALCALVALAAVVVVLLK